LVLDHWEALGTGFFANYTIYSNEIEFYVEDLNTYGIKELKAVYRQVDQEDFDSIAIDTTGENVAAFTPKIADGVEITFDNVLTKGNVTLAQIPVAVDSQLFSSISEFGEYANLTISDQEDEVLRTFSTIGDVVHINTATLTLEGEREVTIHYDPTLLPPGAAPRLFHFNGINWEDVTIRVDQDGHTVTGAASKLSPMVVGFLQTESKFGIGGVKGGLINVESTGPAHVASEIAHVGTIELSFDNVMIPGDVVIVEKSSSELKDLLSRNQHSCWKHLGHQGFCIAKRGPDDGYSAI
jgi:hypothetical protein